MEKGIAYGFFRSSLSLEDLEREFADKYSSTLFLRLNNLTKDTDFNSANGEFRGQVRRAIIG